MKVAMCLLLFAVLTAEDSMFGEGHWNTFMVHTQPLFHGNPINAWDVCIVLVAAFAMSRPSRWRQQIVPLNCALLASASTLLLFVAWGVARGGDLRMAYFQLSALLRLFLLFPVLVLVFRSAKDLKLLAAPIVAAAAYRAVACLVGQAFFMRNIGVFPKWPEYITDHDDSTLWAAVLLGLLVWVVTRPAPRTIVMGGLLGITLLVAIRYNNRRLAWSELFGSLALSYFALPRGPVFKRLNRRALIAAPFVLCYVVVGWGQPGRLFLPVNQLQSMMEGEKNASNNYRILENASLVVTLQQSRLLGTGLGHPFTEVSDRYTRKGLGGWSEYRYIPHNSVLGIASFVGLLGFPFVWAFLPIGTFFAARALARVRRPSEQALCCVALAYPFIYGVQAFGDMGLQSLKANVLMACALAVAARMAALSGGWPVRGLRHSTRLRLASQLDVDMQDKQLPSDVLP